MENKIQSLFGGRVALSVRPRHLRPGQVCEGYIETTTNQDYFAYLMVSIRRTNAAYSTTGISMKYETN
jgi:hypothetical protein